MAAAAAAVRRNAASDAAVTAVAAAVDVLLRDCCSPGLCSAHSIPSRTRAVCRRCVAKRLELNRHKNRNSSIPQVLAAGIFLGQTGFLSCYYFSIEDKDTDISPLSQPCFTY